MKYRCQFNPQERVPKTRSRPVSITVPDQSYTVRELMMKHMSGAMPPVVRDGIYQSFEDEDDIDITQSPDFDITDAFVAAREMEDARVLAKAKLIDVNGEKVTPLPFKDPEDPPTDPPSVK
ncbi:hypothetical protein [Peromfec virus RodF8_52]|uniref:Uncharacterized protein n=1 Tax=Peromfec virus RodF8_52 TaxID=2929381 RepID=A0A976R7P5_9VIRU|nr:hypothetical protein [Peromfec virus RodF8_52]